MTSRLNRTVRHLLLDQRALRRAFPPEVLDRIEQTVVEGERRHAAELRIAIEGALPAGLAWRGFPARERAVDLFGELRVWDTEANNGVLVYILLADHAVEIVADRAAARAIPEARWQEVTRSMVEAFRQGRFQEGCTAAVERLDGLLAEAFPPGAHNPDELPNRPVLL